MPTPGDPSFDREERRARAREAAAAASDERREALRATHLPPARPAARRAGATPAGPRPAAAPPGPRPIDIAAVARVGRAALDKHPGTWTSYAELCSASGLTRTLALVVARQLVPEPTDAHWFRIRDEAGEYHPPTEDVDDADLGPAEADRRLNELGVTTVDGRADPARKLSWTGSGWSVPGSD